MLSRFFRYWNSSEEIEICLEGNESRFARGSFSRRFLSLTLILSSLLISQGNRVSGDETVYDVVVYRGTAGGVTAAIQCARMGKSVVLIEGFHHVSFADWIAHDSRVSAG